MKKVTEKNLKQGQTIYAVRSRCGSSFCEKLPITRLRKEMLTGEDPHFEAREINFYLNDLNIKNGGYSNDKCFYSRRKALSYLKVCLLRKDPEKSDLINNRMELMNNV